MRISKRNAVIAWMLAAGLVLLAGREAGASELAGVMKASPAGEAGNAQEPVELSGDNMEYKTDEGKFVASGHVILRQKNQVLYCDRAEFYRERQEAHAEGNVILDSDKGSVWADKAFYNFRTKKGEFSNARIIFTPIYGRAETISKIRDNYYVMADGFLSTSDYDDPEWRVKSRHIEIYPGNKAVARKSTMYFGGVPVMYLPKYVQDLRKDRPHFSVIPGYKKGWGAFVITSYRVYPMDKVETVYHYDYRERKGAAWGIDIGLTPEKFGHSLLKTYFMSEHTIGAKHLFVTPDEPAVVRERHKAEWRHKWDISPSTSMILQYYKLSDSQILKDYFEREYFNDQTPATYALLTHSTASSSMSLRMDKRVNRFETTVERLPELAYSWNNQPIGDTGLYFKSSNTASQLRYRTPGTIDGVNHTFRFLTDNELSRPFKMGFLEWRPYVGEEEAFYTRTLDDPSADRFRGIFKTGTDVSTKFYRIYDVKFNTMGIEVNRLRHIVTPTVSYNYYHAPTLTSPDLFQYDGVDQRTQVDNFGLGLENKFQTKRDGQAVDLIRSLITTDFRVKDNEVGKGFGDVKLADEYYLNKYVRLSHDLTYDNDRHHLKSANIDLYLTDTKKLEWDIGRRYSFNDADMLTTTVRYRINSRWRMEVFESADVASGRWQEGQYAFVRDLHSWEVEFASHSKFHMDSAGNEFWVIFRLKAFPSVLFSGSKGFSRTMPGSQGNGS
jgi:lipopolysaccharide export system protein LptA